MNGKFWTSARASAVFTLIDLLGAIAIMAIPASMLGAGLARADEPEHSQVPGVVIDYSPASTRQYIGSPSIAVWTNGCYVVSHDFFGPGSTSDHTAVFASTNRGQTWQKLADIQGQWWSTLFVHRSALYLMGTSRENGDAVIRRSTDGGRDWTRSKDAVTGLLLGGGKYHCAPVPVVMHHGRIWRAMEDTLGPGGWARYFRAFVMSAPVDADLLNATNWTCSNRVGGKTNWLDGQFGGWLEGNAVVTTEGEIVDVLRVDVSDAAEKAALVHVSRDGRTATFDAQKDFVDFPGGAKKFTIRFDPQTKLHWSLSNPVLDKNSNLKPGRIRNTLALICSEDLRVWKVKAILLHHPDTERHAFQYVDWQFDGGDLIVVSRTAYDDGLGGAHNQHDANYLTFHRFKNFRQLSLKDSVPVSAAKPAAP